MPLGFRSIQPFQFQACFMVGHGFGFAQEGRIARAAKLLQSAIKQPVPDFCLLGTGTQPKEKTWAVRVVKQGCSLLDVGLSHRFRASHKIDGIPIGRRIKGITFWVQRDISVTDVFDDLGTVWTIGICGDFDRTELPGELVGCHVSDRSLWSWRVDFRVGEGGGAVVAAEDVDAVVEYDGVKIFSGS